MHESALTYNLTRPYPYPWITWVVVIGGIVATALFSVINLAADGYNTNLVFSTNPNQTEHPDSIPWYQKKPWSLASKIPSTCQDQIFTVGSQFYTNNIGLLYALSTGESFNHPIASFHYHDDPFHDCFVQQLNINVTDAPYAEATASAAINCTLYEGSTPISITLSASALIMVYEGVVPTGPSSISQSQSVFLSTDPHAQPSLYWAQALLAQNSLDLAWFGSTRISCNFNKPMVGMGEVLCQSFNGDSGWQTGENGNLTWKEWSSTFGLDMLRQNWFKDDNSESNMPPNVSDAMANMAMFSDGVAKAFQSLILSDLGQAGEANIFTDPQHVLDFINSTIQIEEECFDNLANTGGSFNWPKGLYGDVTNPKLRESAAFFSAANTSLPKVDPAVISAQYLCQVPEMKPAGSLIVSIAVADLVFLQALWLVFNWTVQFIMGRRDPEAHHCAGCAKAAEMAKDEQLTRTASKTSSLVDYKDHPPGPDSVVPASKTYPAIRRRPVASDGGAGAEEQNETEIRLLTDP